jgi:hypothetical protein
MNKKKMTENAISYFNAFKSKNLESLSNLYDDKIKLLDWNGEWNGKEDVLNMNSNLFELEFEFSMTNVETYPDTGITKCYMQIKFENETIDLIDNIFWNDSNKIIVIDAYKQ